MEQSIFRRQLLS